MANRFSLAADIQPTVDDRAAEREGQDLAETLEGELGDLQAGIGDGLDGVGGIGGGGGIARGGGGGLAGAAGAAGLARGAAAGGLAKVALGGAIGFGILAGVKQLSQASPLLGQAVDILSEAANLFFRPFGNFLGKTLRPFATAALDMAVKFNDIAQEDGLAVAVASIASEAATSLGSGFVNALTNIAGGEGTLADFLFAGAGTIALTKLISGVSLTSLVTSVSASSILSSVSVGGLLTSISAGGILTAVGAGGIITAVSAGAIITSVALDDLLQPGETTIPGEEGREDFTLPEGTEVQTLAEDRFAISGPNVRDRVATRAELRRQFGPDQTPPERPGDQPRQDPRRPGDVDTDTVEQLAEDMRATREVLENIEQSDGQLTSGQLANLLPGGVGLSQGTTTTTLDPYS